MSCMWLLDSPFSLLASLCEQVETGNSIITHYDMINCSFWCQSDVVASFVAFCGKVQMDNPKSGRTRLQERLLMTAFHCNV